MSEFATLDTEATDPSTADLDTMPVERLLRTMNAADASVPEAVAGAIPRIAAAVERIVAARRAGGRMLYVGAGTSGRIGVLDAAECAPTFGTDPGEVVGVIAGGPTALIRSVEGAEDDAELAVRDLAAIELRPDDVVIALAASGRTPYAIGALRYARSVGSGTVAISCNPAAELSEHADVAIEIPTGPEVLTGSTRLKAGTAQKLVCNMISTAVMVRSGKVYGNLMVDLHPSNTKLRDRALRIVAEATGVDAATAAALLDAADGNSKTAIVMQLTGSDAERARRLLRDADGFVRDAVRQ
ncbi:N-acetylmuramic acid 6-phosphate etherase [Nocardia sp. NPDC004068]|uniref:N-acetylmuramic acid 6-phosphate etherase n=1 Tax=Nocardia sp. NPDC004068 TaxID=3364303 RepID=UPI0036B4B771